MSLWFLRARAHLGAHSPGPDASPDALKAMGRGKEAPELSCPPLCPQPVWSLAPTVTPAGGAQRAPPAGPPWMWRPGCLTSLSGGPLGRGCQPPSLRKGQSESLPPNRKAPLSLPFRPSSPAQGFGRRSARTQGRRLETPAPEHHRAPGKRVVWEGQFMCVSDWMPVRSARMRQPRAPAHLWPRGERGRAWNSAGSAGRPGVTSGWARPWTRVHPARAGRVRGHVCISVRARGACAHVFTQVVCRRMCVDARV